MTLKISKNIGLTDIVSAGNPITTQHPLSGSTVEQRVFLYNDNAAERFDNISIDPTDTTATDESIWVQLAPDNAGIAGTYLSGGVALSMANIADSNVPKPFWIKVNSGVVPDVQNKTDIKLKVMGKRFAV